MNRFPSLLIAAVLWSIVSWAAEAQNNQADVYPFSWVGVSTYSLDAGSFSRPGESGAVEGTAGDLSYITEQVENGYFSDLGVEALIVSLDFERNTRETSPPDSIEIEAPGEDCALFGSQIASGIGGKETFSGLISAAHKKRIRIVLSIDAILWCGDADAKTLAEWVDDYDLDGIRFESADQLSKDDAAQIRSRFPRTDPVEAAALARKAAAAQAASAQVAAAQAASALSGELPDTDFWIAGVFPDEASSTILALDGSLDAVTIAAWHLDVSEKDSLSALYRRAVAFSVNHPMTSIQTQNVSSLHVGGDSAQFLDAATRLLLQPGAINLLSGAEGSDAAVIEHWQKLGSFRDRHPAIGGGAHEDLSDSPYMFYRGLRVGSEIDEVVVVVGAEGRVRLHVSLVFDDDTVLRDAYTGKIVLVSYGKVSLKAHVNGVILLEEVR